MNACTYNHCEKPIKRNPITITVNGKDEEFDFTGNVQTNLDSLIELGFERKVQNDRYVYNGNYSIYVEVFPFKSTVSAFDTAWGQLKTNIHYFGNNGDVIMLSYSVVQMDSVESFINIQVDKTAHEFSGNFRATLVNDYINTDTMTVRCNYFHCKYSIN